MCSMHIRNLSSAKCSLKQAFEISPLTTPIRWTQYGRPRIGFFSLPVVHNHAALSSDQLCNDDGKCYAKRPHIDCHCRVAVRNLLLEISRRRQVYDLECENEGDGCDDEPGPRVEELLKNAAPIRLALG